MFRSMNTTVQVAVMRGAQTRIGFQ
jgi:hypothetical protein